MSDFKFPDEQDDVKDLDDEIIVEVEDKTPPEDRNKAPLPEKIKEELYNDELEDYSTKVKKKLIQIYSIIVEPFLNILNATMKLSEIMGKLIKSILISKQTKKPKKLLTL
jgi:hypothetical protein